MTALNAKICRKIGKSACAFDSGILEALFSAHFSADVNVEEVKCFAKGR